MKKNSNGPAVIFDNFKQKFTLSDILYPQNLYCMSCEDIIDSNTHIHCLCDECIKEISWLPSIQKNLLRKADKIYYFDNIYSCTLYSKITKNIIGKFKRNRRVFLARPIARLMSEIVFDKKNQYDLLAYVPMSKEKENSRGFNQAKLLAFLISKELDIPICNYLYQINIDKKMKYVDKKNKESFSKESFYLYDDIKIPKGTNILLVDDVITSGSTVNTISALLKKAGANKVDVLVFASQKKLL